MSGISFSNQGRSRRRKEGVTRIVTVCVVSNRFCKAGYLGGSRSADRMFAGMGGSGAHVGSLAHAVRSSSKRGTVAGFIEFSDELSVDAGECLGPPLLHLTLCQHPLRVPHILNVGAVGIARPP
jgi:hypothetical protein